MHVHITNTANFKLKVYIKIICTLCKYTQYFFFIVYMFIFPLRRFLVVAFDMFVYKWNAISSDKTNVSNNFSSFC